MWFLLLHTFAYLPLEWGGVVPGAARPGMPHACQGLNTLVCAQAPCRSAHIIVAHALNPLVLAALFRVNFRS